jgi:DNA polymerase III delta prime subunit
MNIQQAKEQIKNAMKAYFTKDDLGNYVIPIQRQRPVLLIGPPGIGKTAIMEQIAGELGVGLVSYSMTHHTRQSALGLPYITEEEFDGYKYRVSEYTMSEIIGSIYKMMRETGVREGILFLDEINCVSETLAPCMLQFLQYKVFGQHQIPEGWIVVTAGNPPEYNKSVRDFDIVTWDRLKRIDIEPDYETWKNYASSKGVHPSVLTYLAARKKDFYSIESTVDGKHFVAARGWDDLSEMIRLYEQNDLKVDELLIAQYIQNPRIAKDFAIYYDLFNKYRNDYKIESILEGRADEDVLFRAQKAKMDERVSFLGLLFDAVTAKLRDTCERENVLDILTPLLKSLKSDLIAGTENAAEIINGYAENEREKIDKKGRSASVSEDKKKSMQRALAYIEDFRAEVIRQGAADGTEAFEIIKKSFGQSVQELKASAEEGTKVLGNAFDFCEKAFDSGDEILIFVTELTVNYYTARFIGHYGCDKYYMHNSELQFAERQTEIEKQVDELDWEI